MQLENREIAKPLACIHLDKLHRITSIHNKAMSHNPNPLNELWGELCQTYENNENVDSELNNLIRQLPSIESENDLNGLIGLYEVLVIIGAYVSVYSSLDIYLETYCVED